MLDLFLKILLLSFVVFRLAYFVAYDNAPFGIMKSIRAKLGKLTQTKGFFGNCYKTIADAIHCVHCSGVWFSFVFTLYLKPKTITDYLIYVFAIAGIQSFLSFQQRIDE